MGRVGAILRVVAPIALPSIGNAQKLYEWTDQNGIVHYGDSLPPDYTPRPEYPYRGRLELLESRIKLTEVYLGNLRKRWAAGANWFCGIRGVNGTAKSRSSRSRAATHQIQSQQLFQVSK